MTGDTAFIVGAKRDFAQKHAERVEKIAWLNGRIQALREVNGRGFPCDTWLENARAELAALTAGEDTA